MQKEYPTKKSALRMQWRGLMAGLMVLSWAIAVPAVWANNNLEDFDGLPDTPTGWTATGDPVLDYQPMSGNPDGYLSVDFASSLIPPDGGFVISSGARDGFLGDVAARAVSEPLSFNFDLRLADIEPTNVRVYFTGQGNQWESVIDVSGLTLNTWEPIAVPLSYTSTTWNAVGDTLDETVFNANLEEVTQWEVRVASPVNTEASYGFDNVTVVPEPGTIALLVLGGLSLGWARRRSRC